MLEKLRAIICLPTLAVNGYFSLMTPRMSVNGHGTVRINLAFIYLLGYSTYIKKPLY
jgi:hypothetical protein